MTTTTVQGRKAVDASHTIKPNHAIIPVMSNLDDRPKFDVSVATLGGGCFWCLEAIFEQLNGVVSVESGYAGGQINNPDYREVCSGKTGHAEVVQVTFENSELSYEDLLRVFFTVHDPTTLNRQGADVGTQYRSVVFYHSLEQQKAAQAIIAEITQSGIWTNPIVTEVLPYTDFFIAENYHQGYFKRNEEESYCQVVIAPKVAKFRKLYVNRLKALV